MGVKGFRLEGRLGDAETRRGSAARGLEGRRGNAAARRLDGFLVARGLEGRRGNAEARRLAEELRALAVERTPVEDGALREGWRVGRVERVGNRYRVVVENVVPYASHVEVGHRAGSRWVPGRFFLREAEDALIRREGGSRC